MIKILSSAQIKEADHVTITAEPIASIDLMERAASKCTEWILENFPPGISFVIVCGNGNNGGDGLAIARQLFHRGKNVQIIFPDNLKNPSADFTTNLERVKKIEQLHCFTLQEQDKLPDISGNAIIIEAIFGSGLNKKIEGALATLITQLNNLPNPILSIDLPAGLFCDQYSNPDDPIIRATHTLTFQVPKLVFMFPEYAVFTGKWTVLDIGLNEKYLSEVSTNFFISEEEDLRHLLKPRPDFGHKGMFGHALLLAGSTGKAGAAVLSAKACLRSGVGLLTVRLSEKNVSIIQTAVPEAMVSMDEELNYLSAPVKPEMYQAIGIGPGIGTEKETSNVLKRLIQDFDLPIVIDADALNILSQNKTWLSFLKPGCILTPHVGEFKRLVGEYKNPFERVKAQSDFAKKYHCYLILKGKFSALASPDGTIIFNPTGNPGMATGGSGDVLTGIITGLLAQGYSSFQSALIGMYLHGLAGDLAALDLSGNAMIAGDMIDYLPAAFRKINI